MLNFSNLYHFFSLIHPLNIVQRNIINMDPRNAIDNPKPIYYFLPPTIIKNSIKNIIIKRENPKTTPLNLLSVSLSILLGLACDFKTFFDLPIITSFFLFANPCINSIQWLFQKVNTLRRIYSRNFSPRRGLLSFTSRRQLVLKVIYVTRAVCACSVY